MSELRVIHEPRTYERDGQSSFFRDQMDAVGLADRAALARLQRHEHEVQAEIERNTPEGRRALNERMTVLRNHHAGQSGREIPLRELEAEARAATSTTLAGFTTPQWIVSEFAVARSTQRTFADQCKTLPLPGFGLQVHVPRFTSNASAGAVGEGVSVVEVDPSGVDNSENVQTISAQVIASQQLLDKTRNMPDGPAFDTVLYEQLRDDYAQALNNYVLGKSMGAGPTVVGTASFGANNPVSTLYNDVATAREKLTDSAGVRLQPTHLFTTPDMFSYMTRQLDSQNRPIIVPSLAPGVPPGPIAEQGGDEAYKWVQFTGTAVPGMLFWFVDATLPPSGSAGTVSPIVVSRPDKIVVWEGEPVMRAFPETIANQLQVVVQLYNYAACVPRYPGSTVTIVGNAYQTNLV